MREVGPYDYICFVFMRSENGSIRQVRAFSRDCAIDAPGSTIYWLQDVEPAQSVAYLESLLKLGTPAVEKVMKLSARSRCTLELHPMQLLRDWSNRGSPQNHEVRLPFGLAALARPTASIFYLR